MKHHPLQQYAFAAIDLTVTPQGDWYFIEANSWPGVLRETMEVAQTKLCRPLEQLFALMETVVSPVKIHYIESSKHLNNAIKNPIFIQNYYLNKLGKEHFVTHEIADTEPETLDTWFTQHKEHIRDGIILTRFIKVKELLHKHNILNVINPAPVSLLTINKFRISTELESNEYFNVPKTFLCTKPEEVERHVTLHNLNKIVLKPRYGQKGIGVTFMHANDLKLDTLDWQLEWVLQEQVETAMKDGKYWDIRANVINGTFTDSLLRTSDSRVVSITQGGEALPIPPNIQAIAKTASEACVRMINTLAYKKP